MVGARRQHNIWCEVSFGVGHRTSGEFKDRLYWERLPSVFAQETRNLLVLLSASDCYQHSTCNLHSFGWQRNHQQRLHRQRRDEEISYRCDSGTALTIRFAIFARNYKFKSRFKRSREGDSCTHWDQYWMEQRELFTFDISREEVKYRWTVFWP